MLRAAAAVERAGLPTASIVGSGFLAQAEVIQRGLAVPLAIGTYPGAPMVDSEEALAGKVAEVLAPGLVEGLTGARPVACADEAEPEPGAIVLRGTYDDVQEHFHQRLWTDGLPVTPPTRDRVDAFLAFTERAPDEVIRVVPQEGREASILAIAVNGVMAGCRPEYMPLLVAVVEAMCDPEFRIEDAGSTPGWEPLVIVNGPIARQLDFNSGQGVMRVGRRANTSLGRFVRLFLRNLCGYRIPPGAGDKGSIGQSFLVALAEDEDAAHRIGWPTFAEERGFARGESVVTVQSVVVTTPPMYSAGAHALDHARQWADLMQGSFAYWSHAGFKRGRWHPLIVAGPAIAEAIAREWSRDELRRYLHEHVRVSAGMIAHYARMTTTPTFDLKRLADEGLVPASYVESDDPDRMLPAILDPAMIGIVVAGDPGRNQSRAYMNNHVQGPPTSRRVRLPPDWEARLARRAT